MKCTPDASELLSIARETYTAQLLPALPENLRYTALMVANAMAIARREIEAGEEPARAELRRLRVLFSEGSNEPDANERRGTVADYNRRLVQAIRAGRYDSDNAALLEHLRRTTEEKLAISNPKALSGP